MSSVTYDVIIPIYKVKPKWITECLDSVIAQKIQDWRVIIVDGTPAEDESVSYTHLTLPTTPYV